MKKILFIAAVACLSFAACEELENGGTGDLNDNPILSDKPTEELQPSEQKTKLETVARNFMEECPAEDFEKIAGIAEAFSETFDVEDYDLDPFYEWVGRQLETMDNGDYKIETSNGKVDITKTVDVLFLIANHKGHFNFGENGMTVDTLYNGLKATCTVNGKNYEAVIKQSGKVTNAIYKSIDNDSYIDDGYFDTEGKYIHIGSPTQINDNWSMKLTVGVPERLDISIKENGSPLAEVVAKFTPSFTASGIVLSKDSFSSEVTIRMEDYEYVVENLKYNGATGKASTSQTLKKNGKTLLHYNVSGDVRIETETVKQEWENGSSEYQYIKASLAKDLTAAMDILGEIQVIGKCSNAMEASEELEAFWEALDVDEEDIAQRHLDNFNAKFDFGVFYDKGNNRQADLEFEYIHHQGEQADWDINGDGLVNGNDRYNEYYELIPVIVFNDGSRNSIEDFFTESAFGDLVEEFYEFCEGFSEMFGFGFAEELEPMPDYGVM